MRRSTLAQIAACLLGGHVVGRPENLAADREPRGVLLLNEAKVDDVGLPAAIAAALDEHVPRLEVAMDQPDRVRGLHGLADLPQDGDALFD